MSKHPNHRRGEPRSQDNGSTWEGDPNDGGRGVRRARKSWRALTRRSERRTGEPSPKTRHMGKSSALRSKHRPGGFGLMDDVDGDLAEIEGIVAAREEREADRKTLKRDVNAIVRAVLLLDVFLREPRDRVEVFDAIICACHIYAGSQVANVAREVLFARRTKRSELGHYPRGGKKP